MLNENFWLDKKIFITGHTGFKGSWLALYLSQLGAKLYGYALKPPTNPSLFTCAKVESLFEKSYLGDINDYTSLNKSIKESTPDIIIHMAAQPLVRASYDNPLYTYQTNVLGTANVLESIKTSPTVKSCLIITTDKCYKNNEWHWGYRENDQLGGYDPYSASKACAELVTASYRQSFFSNSDTAIATARAGNVIGGGDWAKDRLIPDCLKAISNNKPIEIRSPNAIRPWQHVLEALHGYLLLIENLYTNGNKFAESWNFGPNNESIISVGTIVKKLCDKLDGKYTIKNNALDKHEAAHLQLDCSKAKALLNWQPVLSIEQTIDFIVDWHAAYTQNQNMQKKTLDQIKQYIELTKENK